MSTTTQRKKTSNSFKVGLVVLFIILIVVAVASLIGIIDLTWLGNGFLSIQTWSATDLVYAVLIDTAFIFIGIGIMFFYFTYVRGNKVVGTQTQQPGYAPIPAYPATTQKDTETVIS